MRGRPRGRNPRGRGGRMYSASRRDSSLFDILGELLFVFPGDLLILFQSSLEGSLGRVLVQLGPFFPPAIGEKMKSTNEAPPNAASR